MPPKPLHRVLLALFFAALLANTLALHPVSAAGPVTAHKNPAIPPNSRYLNGFRFMVASDSHIGYVKGERSTRAALVEIEENRNPSFVIHMGDLTETGSVAEYARFLEIFSTLDVPLFPTLGNHESRWQDQTGGTFKRAFGHSSYSFDYGPWHFVVLDTSVPGQTYGSIDPSVWEWLDKDLASQPEGRPVAVFSHHPLLYEAQSFQDSDDNMRRFIDKYPIRVVFSGHGHSFIHWRTQGVDCFMVGALMDGSFAEVTVQGQNISVNSVTVSLAGEVEERQAFYLLNESRIDTPIGTLEATESSGMLQASFTLAKPAQVQFQIDEGAFNLLGDYETGSHRFYQDVSGQACGLHTLRIKAISSGSEFISSVEFEKGPSLALWRTDLGSAAVGTLVQSGNMLVAGTRDGRVMALDSEDGEIKWEYHSGGPWGGGAVNGGRLFFGTALGEIHCVRAADGKMIWKTKIPDESFSAPPLVITISGRTVFAGSDSGTMYAFDARNGRVRWTFKSGGAITSVPSIGRGVLAFGSWDGNLYGVSPKDGSLVWKNTLGRQVYYSPHHSPLYMDGKFFTTTPYDAYTGGSFLLTVDARTGSILGKHTSASTLSGLAAGDQNSVVVRDGNGRVQRFDSDGSVLSLEGLPSLFSSPICLEDICVTGGTRGVINIFTDEGKYDYSVRDSMLFVDPVVLSHRSGGTAVVVADSRGSLWSLSVPGTLK